MKQPTGLTSDDPILILPGLVGEAQRDGIISDMFGEEHVDWTLEDRKLIMKDRATTRIVDRVTLNVRGTRQILYFYRDRSQPLSPDTKRVTDAVDRAAFKRLDQLQVPVSFPRVVFLQMYMVLAELARNEHVAEFSLAGSGVDFVNTVAHFADSFMAAKRETDPQSDTIVVDLSGREWAAVRVVLRHFEEALAVPELREVQASFLLAVDDAVREATQRSHWTGAFSPVSIVQTHDVGPDGFSKIDLVVGEHISEEELSKAKSLSGEEHLYSTHSYRNGELERQFVTKERHAVMKAMMDAIDSQGIYYAREAAGDDATGTVKSKAPLIFLLLVVLIAAFLLFRP